MGSDNLVSTVVDALTTCDDPGPAAPVLPAQNHRVPAPVATFAASRHFGANGTRLVIRVVGEIDLVTAPALARALLLGSSDMWPPEEVTEVVVDLHAVTFLSAAGLRELVRMRQRCHRRGMSVWVLADQSAVTTPMRLTGLDRTLGLRSDLEH